MKKDIKTEIPTPRIIKFNKNMKNSKMKQLVIFSFMIAYTHTLTYWFDVSDGFPVSSVSIVGLKEEYVTLGRIPDFNTYSIDWEAGTATEVKNINIGAGGNLQSADSRMSAGSSGSAILASRTILRYNSLPNKPANMEEYQVLKGVGKYEYPKMVEGTAYALVGTVHAFSKFYRLNIDQVNDLKEYTVADVSRAYSFLYGTTWFVASIRNNNFRTLFDYTNGYIGGVTVQQRRTSRPGSLMSLG